MNSIRKVASSFLMLRLLLCEKACQGHDVGIDFLLGHRRCITIDSHDQSYDKVTEAARALRSRCVVYERFYEGNVSRAYRVCSNTNVTRCVSRLEQQVTNTAATGTSNMVDLTS